jgi:hypothetical protein
MIRVDDGEPIGRSSNRSFDEDLTIPSEKATVLPRLEVRTENKP